MQEFAYLPQCCSETECRRFPWGNGEPRVAMLGGNMMSILKRTELSFECIARCLSGLAFLLAIAANSTAQAQAGGEAIYGVTTLDVAPSAASQGVALLKQYRDAALKQAGNQGVTLVQEAGWPNRFVIYDGWKDRSAYEANEKAAHLAALRDKLKPIAGAPYD